MKIPRRTNFLFGLVILAAAIVFLLQALDVIPVGIADIINRAWPVVLVLFGLGIFLRDRVRLGGLIALMVGGLLVGGMAATAFSSRATGQRTDYTEPINQPVTAGINLIRVSVQTLSTDVEIVRSLDARLISGEFVGSSESLLTTTYTEGDDSTANLTITETQPNQFPLLERMGRGRFTLELPADVAIDFDFRGSDGILTLNMSGLSLERLNMDLAKGDALVTIPAYQPLSAREDSPIGTFIVRDGDINVFVPPNVGARFELNRGGSGLEPIFDTLDFNYLVGDILEARTFDAAEIKLRYAITAPRGQITIGSTGTE
ncbi:MAG: hypothetical protein LCI00_21260 [Chloroflexi bacterium]|nr:hypothetical protein [Chloroflexota bacterium]MCC6892361.1 hypothetical protein [Anaerolineae bacterium]